MDHKNATASPRALFPVLARLGALRVMLAVGALVLLFTAPDPGTRPQFHGWEMIVTLIVPTLVPIVFMVLLLDVMMSTIFMVDKRGTERARLKHIVILELLLAATLIVVWFPYFRAIM